MPHHWRRIAGRPYAYLAVGEPSTRASFPVADVGSDASVTGRVMLVTGYLDRMRVAGVELTDRRRAVAAMLAASNPDALEEAASAAARLCASARARPAEGVVTVRGFASRWTSGELARAHPDRVKAIDHRDNVTRLERYIFPHVGDLPIADLTLQRGDEVLAALPPGASRALRRHVAQCLVHLARLAVYPGRVLAASPFPKGWLPGLGKPPIAPFLYPEEDARLLGCVSVPLVRRIAWGILAREGLRSAELVGRMRAGLVVHSPLPWTAVDMTHGVIAVLKNKTEAPRHWPLDPGVARALRKWLEFSRGGLEFGFVVGHIAHVAEHLRADLRAAGVTRAELFEAEKGRARLKAHHLRGTFVTLSLADGKTETWVQDRTGHTSTLMIQRYRRAARMAGELGLGPLRSMDEAIPELR